jgi:hypothetical protein
MKLILILLHLVIFSLLAVAQEADGYYINKNGDTLRGKIQVPLKPKLKLGASSQQTADRIRDDVPDESKEIEFAKLAFDFRFSSNGEKSKKIDRLKVKGFGFVYEGKAYDFITWDVSANKQLYLIPATGNVAPDGVYFILLSIKGVFPIYSLFQEVEMERRLPGRREYDGNATKRDLIFKHPSKGYIYISDQYPMKMKMAEALEYLELETDFLKTLTKKDDLLEVIKKYNKWKATM